MEKLESTVPARVEAAAVSDGLALIWIWGAFPPFATRACEPKPALRHPKKTAAGHQVEREYVNQCEYE